MIRYLEGQGIQIDSVEETHGPSDVTTYAPCALRGSDVVFLSGGDGSIAEAVDGLVNTETALAVLPSGTGNVFACSSICPCRAASILGPCSSPHVSCWPARCGESMWAARPPQAAMTLPAISSCGAASASTPR